MSEDKKDILKALDEVEKKSAELNEKKKLTAERIKKHIQPKPEIDVQTKLKLAHQEERSKEIHEFKHKALLGGLLFMLTLVITFSLSREARTSMIEYMIILMLVLGLMAAKGKR